MGDLDLVQTGFWKSSVSVRVICELPSIVKTVSEAK